MSETLSHSDQVTYLQIAVEQAGQRIDNFLLTYFKSVPKSHIYRILRTGEVRVNKGRIKPVYRLQIGDKVRLPPMHYQTTTSVIPHIHSVQILTKRILYEDNFLLVIDKPSGMAVHGGSGISFGVIEGLRTLYPQAPFLELVHRLDRETSGCLMIAKKRSMLRRLHDLLRQGGMRKRYLALVQGRWQSRLKQISMPLQKNILQSGERIVRVNETDGKAAISNFQIEEEFESATLLNVQPITGRTHQIRVHATHADHPIAGDEKYGNEAFNRQMRDYSLKRLFLHAAQLEIEIPDQNYQLSINAPLPTELQQVLNRLSK